MRASSSKSSKSNNSIIVSVAGLYPGCARHCDLEDFGRNVLIEEELCLPIPAARWDAEATYHPNGPPGTSYMRVGIFVTGLEDFDCSAFQIASAEAVGMDPQARVLLELSNAALIRGASTTKFGKDVASLVLGMGVYVGLCMYPDYLDLSNASNLNKRVSSTTIMGSGMGSSLVVGRISYLLGSQGPCLSTDTACSSSLVSTHLAHMSLQTGETKHSISIGANTMVTENVTLMFCTLATLSPDGRSKSFDQSVDGYGRGEALAAMMLSTEQSPMLLSDHHGMVCGSAINQDGRSAGLTVPNGPSQTNLILQALKSGNISRKFLKFVAVHGTGTPLGDPIEIGALSHAAECGERKWLAVGSVKSCYGHTEGAAGITGLWMAAVGLQKQAGPGIMHLRTPNPHVTAAWKDWVSKNDLWPWAPRQCGAGAMAESRSIVGSTSSFGISGVNAHCCIRVVGEDHAASYSKEPSSWWVVQRFWPIISSHGSGIRCVTVENMKSLASVGMTLECDLEGLKMRLARDHMVQGRVLLPGSAIYEIMLIGGSIVLDNDWRRSCADFAIASISLETAILISLTASQVKGTRVQLSISASEGRSTGRVSTSSTLASRQIRHACNDYIYQDYLAGTGLKHFVNVDGVAMLHDVDSKENLHESSFVFGTLACPNEGTIPKIDQYANHPCVVDAAAHTLAFEMSNEIVCVNARAQVKYALAVGKTCRVPANIEAFRGSFSRHMIDASQQHQNMNSVWVLSQLNHKSNSHKFGIRNAELANPQLNVANMRLSNPVAKGVKKSSQAYNDRRNIVKCKQFEIGSNINDIIHIRESSKNMAAFVHVANKINLSITRSLGTYKMLLLGQALSKVAHSSTDCPEFLHDLNVMLPLNVHENKGGLQVPKLSCTLDPSLMAEALHGMLRTIALEAPNLKLKVTREDVQTPLGRRVLRPKARNVTDSYGTEHHACCFSYPLLVRSANLAPICSAKHGRHSKSSILITGGLGGLGLLMINWATSGKRTSQVLALGRSGRCDLKGWPNVIASNDTDNAALVTAQGCDAAAKADIVDMGWGRSSAIVHSGGVLQDARLSNQDSRRLRQVMAPKVTGIELLARHAGVGEADMTLVFSSVTSFMGAIGQSNYAAANAMLDAWADYVNRAGVPARSIQWGAWGGVGMAAGNKLVVANLATKGLALVHPLQGLAALSLAWNAPASSALPCPLLATPLDSSRLQRMPDTNVVPEIYRELSSSQSIVTTNVKPELPLAIKAFNTERASRIVFQTPASKTNHQSASITWEDVRAAIQEMVGGILGDVVDESTPLMEAGLDSLGVVELKNEIESKFDLQVPATLALDYPTMADLATLVHKMMSVTKDTIDIKPSTNHKSSNEVLMLV
eukprot:scaffold136522_cov47-Prasinocladus_malaysianus.AAC.1